MRGTRADRGTYALLRMFLSSLFVLLPVALVGLSLTAQQTFVSCTEEHSGDLILDGDDTLTISGGVFCQHGNINVRGNAQLVISDATLRMESPSPDIWGGRTFIFVEDRARVTIRNSVIECAGGATDLHAWGTTSVVIDTLSTRAQRDLYLVCGGNSQCAIRNSAIAVTDVRDQGTLVVSDSSVAEIGLYFTGDAGSVELEGLGERLYEAWQTPAAWNTGYQIRLENANVGGWWLDLSQGANLRLRDSSVHGITLTLSGASGELVGLKPGYFEAWQLANANRGVFGMTLDLARANVASWILVLNGEDTTLGLTDVMLAELDVYDISVGLTASNVSIAGIRLERASGSLNSSGNVVLQRIKLAGASFAFTGKIAWPADPAVVSWNDSTLTRQYEVQARTPAGETAGAVELLLTAPDGTGTRFSTSQDGTGFCTIAFNDSNYGKTWRLRTTLDPNSAIMLLSLLTSTPVVVTAPQ